MDNGVVEPLAIEDRATRALHPDAPRLARLPFEGRQALPGIEQGILARGPIAVVSPGLKVASVRFAGKSRHAASKAVRASQKVAAVPELESPGLLPG